MNSAYPRSPTYRRALVLGLGSSGWAAVRLLLEEGTKVVAIDQNDNEELQKQAGPLRQAGAGIFLGGKTLPPGKFDAAIVSPGVPLRSPWIEELKVRGVPLISELELGWSRRGSRVIAVTGSNGKSTVVKWLAESLQAAGLRAVAAGNYGPPACEVVRTNRELDWLILEVSSFQLETVNAFRPDIGVLLNCHPNHLDRHRDMEEYLGWKAGMFSKCAASDVCIVHESLLEKVKAISKSRGRWISFGLGAHASYRYRQGWVDKDGQPLASLENTCFANEVLGVNAAAALAVVSACGVNTDFAVQAAREFQSLPHRLQKIGEVNGVVFINDSKATNLAALRAALQMVPLPVRLLAGGLAKETDFTALKDILAKKVKGVYLIGKAAGLMKAAWSDVVPCWECGTLEKAVSEASREARPGEAVLLSPGCASFDQFDNFEERGNLFVKRIKILGKSGKSCINNHSLTTH